MESHFINKKKTLRTKDRILLEAAILFAHRGYSAVSMRDIAEKVEIKPPSIYAHFSSKEEIFEVIINNIRDIYLDFHVRTEKEMKNATSFEQVLDNIFAELKEIYDIYIYYGISLIMTEQFSNEKARDILNNVLIKVGSEYSKTKFDECIKRGWVKEFNTKAVSTLIMNSILIGTLMRTHDDMKHESAYDAEEMFVSLQQLILDSVEIIK